MKHIAKAAKIILSALILGLLTQPALMADEQPVAVSLTAPGTVLYGTTISLAGSVLPAHPSETVSITSTPAGGTISTASVIQSASGTFSYSTKPVKNTVYRALFVHEGSTKASSFKKVYVKPKVSLTAAKTSIYANEPTKLTLQVTPLRPNATVAIEQYFPTGWKVIKKGPLNSYSKMTHVFRPATAKKYYFRARYYADSQYAANLTVKRSINAKKPFAVVHSSYTLKKSAQGIYYTSRVNTAYDVLINEFGKYSTRKLSDADVANVATLRKYKVVSFIGMTCVSKAQREAIRTYVKGGGKIIASFGLARNDSDGYPLIWRYQFKSSWDLSRFWEWEEVSEVYQLKFNNDPLMETGYRVNNGGSTHPIIANTKKALGISRINMASGLPAYNELNWSMKNNPNVVPILFFDTKSNSKSADDSSHGYGAAWVSKYYKGASVYYNFMLHDFFWPGHKDASKGNNLAVAKTLFINSVKWLRDTPVTGKMVKATNPTASSWLSGNSGAGHAINVKHTVTNSGNIQLRGEYFVEIYRNGSLAYRNKTTQPVPLGPATSWTYNAWRYYIGNPAASNFTVRVGSHMFDANRGGIVRSYRDYNYKYSSGSMSLASVGAIIVSK